MNAQRHPSLANGDRACEQVARLDWLDLGARIRQAALAAAAMEMVEGACGGSDGVAARPVESGQS